MKILYASSSVGLGHITRDYHISKFLNGKITWLTSGNALNYIKSKSEKYEDISESMKSLGIYIGNMIKDCEVKINPINSYSLYKAVKYNSDLIRSHINFDDYDLIVSDEFWEFMFIDIPKERSIFLTDFTKVTSKSGYFERYIIPRLNKGLKERIENKFLLKINLSVWDKDEGYINLGPAYTNDYSNIISREGDYILINIGGTNAGLKIAEKIAEKIKSKYDVKIIGSDKYFNPNPLDMIANAKVIISLSGYGSIIESNVLKKKTIFLYINNHFEHEENSKIMRNRKGFRVYSCKDIVNIDVLNIIEKLMEEDKIENLKLDDSAKKVAEIINKSQVSDS